MVRRLDIWDFGVAGLLTTHRTKGFLETPIYQDRAKGGLDPEDTMSTLGFRHPQ